jgi:hypothetical protein
MWMLSGNEHSMFLAWHSSAVVHPEWREAADKELGLEVIVLVSRVRPRPKSLEHFCKDLVRPYTLFSFLDKRDISQTQEGTTMRKRIAGILALVVLVGGLAHADPIPIKVKLPPIVLGKPCGWTGC